MLVDPPAGLDEQAVLEQAQREGMLTLRDSARMAVLQGDTSIREMIRVVTTES